MAVAVNFEYGRSCGYSLASQAIRSQLAMDLFFSSHYEETRVASARDVIDLDFKSFKEKDVFYSLTVPLRGLGKVVCIASAVLFVAPIGILYNLGATLFYLVSVPIAAEGEEREKRWEEVAGHVNGLINDCQVALAGCAVCFVSALAVGVFLSLLYITTTLAPVVLLAIAMQQWGAALVVSSTLGFCLVMHPITLTSVFGMSLMLSFFLNEMAASIACDPAEQERFIMALKLKETFGLVNEEGELLEINNIVEFKRQLLELGIQYKQEERIFQDKRRFCARQGVGLDVLNECEAAMRKTREIYDAIFELLKA